MRDHLATLLDDFRRYAGEIAVVRYQGNRRRVSTYGELTRLAGRFAELLKRQGIGSGDRVLLWAENSTEWMAAFYGCMLRGVLAVPLDAAGSPEFAARVAADVQPKLAVGDAVLLAQLDSATEHYKAEDSSHPGCKNAARVGLPASEDEVDQLALSFNGQPFPRLAFEDWLSELPQEESGPIDGLSHKTQLQILFTSGTTGDPKGIVITHGNVLASISPIEDGAQPYMRYEWLIHPLRILHTLPLSHVFGQTMGLWVPPIFRAELHFESRPAAPRLIQLIKEERISVLAAVPRVLALLKAHLESIDCTLAARVERTKNIRPFMKWWRFRKVHRAFGLKFWAFVSGGGALPGPLEQFWNALGFVLVQGYGMTETTALITLNHPFHVARGTIGKPLAGREVKLGPDGEVLVRGPMISSATWQGGQLRLREDDWLATGDIAEKQTTGELKFLGRKSEVIVTAAGLNLHPEDIETAIEEQPGVAACAVVAMQTPAGAEPCAVLAVRGSGDLAAKAVEAANAHLAEFQRIRRWVLWPEPDLPRTSTGKVKRKPVAAWLAQVQAAASGEAGVSSFGASSDWLMTLIAQISGETPHSAGDELRLAEDLHLDSLGRVQLAGAIEERLGIVSASGLLEEVETLGDLRRLVAGDSDGLADNEKGAGAPQGSPTLLQNARKDGAPAVTQTPAQSAAVRRTLSSAEPHRTQFIYPEWPWWKPVEWIRIAFIETVMRLLVWLLAHPRIVGPEQPLPQGPMLIVANHVTSYDAPLVQYGLAGRIRRRMAAAMMGQMLEDYRHWRNPEAPPGKQGFYVFGPASYYLVTALFNVFPLPRQRDFQASFAHAGKAMDRGYNVLIFPEGARTPEGKLARFRPGIGILAKESNVPVLPIAIRGLGELKVKGSGWFRSGTIEVHIGAPIRFAPEETEAAITQRLQDEVLRLLER